MGSPPHRRSPAPSLRSSQSARPSATCHTQRGTTMKKLTAKIAIGSLVAAGAALAGPSAPGQRIRHGGHATSRCRSRAASTWVSNVYSGPQPRPGHRLQPQRRRGRHRRGRRLRHRRHLAPTSATTPTAAGSRSATATATTTRYAHLSAPLRQGRPEGRAGHRRSVRSATPAARTAPHLHYEQRLNGNDVRPRFNGVDRRVRQEHLHVEELRRRLQHAQQPPVDQATPAAPATRSSTPRPSPAPRST